MSEGFTPEPGKVVVVESIPLCDFCAQNDFEERGQYDFKTSFGPWAHGCEAHWKLYRASPLLGGGRGQQWNTQDEVKGS